MGCRILKFELQICFATLLKLHFCMAVLLKICCIFSQHLFLRAPLEGCFWSSFNVLYYSEEEFARSRKLRTTFKQSAGYADVF